MTHDEARLACSRKLDGELEAETLDALSSHLSSCANCRDFSASLDKSLCALKDSVEGLEMPAAVHTRIMDQVQHLPQSRPWTTWLAPTAAIAFAAASVMVILRAPTQHVQGLPAEIRTVEGILKAPQSALPRLIMRGSQTEPTEADWAQVLDRMHLTDPMHRKTAVDLLNRRLARQERIQGSLAAGNIGEGNDGLLAIPEGVPGPQTEERALISAENEDRVRWITLCAKNPAPGMSASQQEREAALRQAFIATRAELMKPGDWLQSQDGAWHRRD